MSKVNIANLRAIIPVKNPEDKKDERMAALSAILGPKGIKAIAVLKTFDDAVSEFKYPAGTPITVKIFAYLNKSGKADDYKVTVCTPSVTHIVKSKLKIETLSKKPGKEKVKDVDVKFVEEIMNMKFPYADSADKEGYKNSIIGTLKSMGISVT